MYGAQGLGACHRVEPGGQRGFNVGEIGELEDAADDRAKRALAQPLGAGVDRHDALEVDEAFLAVFVFDDLELRVVDEHLRSLGLGLAVDDHALTGGKELLDVVSVEPAQGEQRTQRVAFNFLQGGLKHLTAAAEAFSGGGNHDTADADRRVRGGVREVLEVAAVLVASRVVGKQVADRVQVETF